MTTATTSTLKLTKTERDTLQAFVRRLLHTEEANDILDYAGEIVGHGKNLSEHEMDLRDWGITYGLAVGVLAVEKPLADPQERAKVAHSIAVDVYTAWGIEIAARPNLAKAIDDVLVARETGDDRDAGRNPSLHDALIDLSAAWGPALATNGGEA